MATPLEDYWGEANPKPKSLRGFSTACWRGYIGTWRIEDERLIFVKFERRKLERQGEDLIEITEPLSKVELLGTPTEAEMEAKWFSGVLRIARGEQLVYVHMGYGSVYEEDLFLFVDRGKAFRRFTVKNDPEKLTSSIDLSWRELGNMTDSGGVKASLPESRENQSDGDWLTLREIHAQFEPLKDSGKTFRTRGIYFPDQLWFPPQYGDDATISLRFTNSVEQPQVGSAVEITCTLEHKDYAMVFAVSALKVLKPGAAIQRPPPADHR